MATSSILDTSWCFLLKIYSIPLLSKPFLKHEMIFHSALQCVPSLIPQLLENIVVCDGYTLLNGNKERLQRELTPVLLILRAAFCLLRSTIQIWFSREARSSSTSNIKDNVYSKNLMNLVQYKAANLFEILCFIINFK